MKEKEDRIEELEEALRESVKITAEREMLLMEQKMQIDASQSTVCSSTYFNYRRFNAYSPDKCF